jgi:2-dehydropantoate 2-reductase
VGDIVAAGAVQMAMALLDECAAIAGAEGHPPGPAAMERSRGMLSEPGSPLTASMFRDIEAKRPIEGDHIVGDLLRRGESRSLATPLLAVANAHLRAYEIGRERTQMTQKTQ